MPTTPPLPTVASSQRPANASSQRPAVTSSQRPAIELRDPVHGAIPVNAGELAVIDTPLFQRLRGVRQLGFGEHVFPGAVHHRYLHSIGAMHVAGRVAEKLIARFTLAPASETRFIQLARLAALLHDVGHPPLSHAAESLLPTRGELLGPDVTDAGSVASHEDMTHLILTASHLSTTLDAAFADLGIKSGDIAAIITDKYPKGDVFVESGCESGPDGNIDFGPLLHQLVSGELDVDRMDYLLRDSYFTGVRYGTYDQLWLLSNIEAVVVDGASEVAGAAGVRGVNGAAGIAGIAGIAGVAGIARLAVDMRALPAFEHFLLARYHMFQMVYYHPISDAYDATLRRYLASVGPEARFPADLDAFVHCTDAWLKTRLEASSDEWARRVVERRPYALLAELRTDDERRTLRPLLDDAMRREGIALHWHSARPVLSRYAVSPVAHRNDPLLVVDHRPPVGRGPRIRPIEEVTDLFERYERVLRIERAYVLPEDRKRARELQRSLG